MPTKPTTTAATIGKGNADKVASRRRGKVDEMIERSRQGAPAPEVTPHPKPTGGKHRSARLAGTIAGVETATTSARKTAREHEAEMLAVEAEATTEVASADRIERIRLAKAEKLVLNAWFLAGGAPPRPATPNLDAIHAEGQRPAGAKKATPKTAGTPRGPRTARPEVYVQALAAREAGLAAGTRVGNTRLDDAALLDAVRTIRTATPALTAEQVREVGRWIHGYSWNHARIIAVWEATTPA